jgi:hypothetical protein
MGLDGRQGFEQLGKVEADVDVPYHRCKRRNMIVRSADAR